MAQKREKCKKITTEIVFVHFRCRSFFNQLIFAFLSLDTITVKNLSNLTDLILRIFEYASRNRCPTKGIFCAAEFLVNINIIQLKNIANYKTVT